MRRESGDQLRAGSTTGVVVPWAIIVFGFITGVA